MISASSSEESVSYADVGNEILEMLRTAARLAEVTRGAEHRVRARRQRESKKLCRLRVVACDRKRARAVIAATSSSSSSTSFSPSSSSSSSLSSASLHSSVLSDTSHSSSNSSSSTQSAGGSPDAEQFRCDKKMAAFAADLAVWAEGEAYCRWIEVKDSRVRTRRDLMREVAESFRKRLLLPDNIFFAQLRMSKQTLYRLALLVKPLSFRSPSMRGRNPEPFIFAVTYTIRCLAQGVSSWSALSVDWNVGESTLRGWIPQTCRVISEALPLPHQSVPSDTYAWQACFDGFLKLVCGSLDPFTDLGSLPTRQVRLYTISVS
jgi:hypothetical protein